MLYRTALSPAFSGGSSLRSYESLFVYIIARMKISEFLNGLFTITRILLYNSAVLWAPDPFLRRRVRNFDDIFGSDSDRTDGEKSALASACRPVRYNDFVRRYYYDLRLRRVNIENRTASSARVGQQLFCRRFMRTVHTINTRFTYIYTYIVTETRREETRTTLFVERHTVYYPRLRF